MKKKFIRFTAWLLALCMILSLMPDVKANAEDGADVPEISTIDELCELVDDDMAWFVDGSNRIGDIPAQTLAFYSLTYKLNYDAKKGMTYSLDKKSDGYRLLCNEDNSKYIDFIFKNGKLDQFGSPGWMWYRPVWIDNAVKLNCTLEEHDFSGDHVMFWNKTEKSVVILKYSKKSMYVEVADSIPMSKEELDSIEEGKIYYRANGSTKYVECNNVHTEKHTRYIKHEGTPATCTESGEREYYKCSRCFVLFDEDDNEIDENDIVIPIDPNAHSYDKTEWGYDSEHHWHPSTCGHDDAKTQYQNHFFIDGDTCDYCEYTRENTNINPGDDQPGNDEPGKEELPTWEQIYTVVDPVLKDFEGTDLASPEVTLSWDEIAEGSDKTLVDFLERKRMMNPIIKKSEDGAIRAKHIIEDDYVDFYFKDGDINSELEKIVMKVADINMELKKHENTVPTAKPSEEPTAEPTKDPEVKPTVKPVVKPTVVPSEEPSIAPSEEPTVEPTVKPSEAPVIVKGTSYDTLEVSEILKSNGKFKALTVSENNGVLTVPAGTKLELGGANWGIKGYYDGRVVSANQIKWEATDDSKASKKALKKYAATKFNKKANTTKITTKANKKVAGSVYAVKLVNDNGNTIILNIERDEINKAVKKTKLSKADSKKSVSFEDLASMKDSTGVKTVNLSLAGLDEGKKSAFNNNAITWIVGSGKNAIILKPGKVTAYETKKGTVAYLTVTDDASVKVLSGDTKGTIKLSATVDRKSFKTSIKVK